LVRHLKGGGPGGQKGGPRRGDLNTTTREIAKMKKTGGALMKKPLVGGTLHVKRLKILLQKGY